MDDKTMYTQQPADPNGDGNQGRLKQGSPQTSAQKCFYTFYYVASTCFYHIIHKYTNQTIITTTRLEDESGLISSSLH